MEASLLSSPAGIKKILFSEEQIKLKVKQTGKLISSEYEGKPLLILGILKGSFIFMADLCREITIPCETAFITAESYHSGTESSGAVRITHDIKQNLSEYHVIIAEDIVDSGQTLSKLIRMLDKMKPLSLSVYALLDKPSRRAAVISAYHSLFTVPDSFVVGYGLDFNEQYRNLPYIAEIY